MTPVGLTNLHAFQRQSYNPGGHQLFQIKAVLVCLMLGLAAGLARADQFANPLDVRTADPEVLLDNGVYYMYGTSGGKSYKVWTSTDLVNWRDRGLAFSAGAANWGKDRFWAPEVSKIQGKYYLFYSAGGGADDVMRICVASATSPLGPFSDIAAPLFDNGQAYIDAHCFVDTDGQAYLYCSQDMSVPADSKSEIVVARLNATFTGLATQPTLCITPNVAWEITSSGKKWNEAPTVIRHGSYYYLLYSGNVYSSPNYAIGYAYATSPTGPWTKYSGNPIVKKTATVSGPGHCSLTTSPDGTQIWLVYHTQQQLSGGGERQLAIDRVSFVEKPSGPAVLSAAGAPSTALQNAPSGSTAFPAGGSDEFNSTTLNRGKWTFFNESASNYKLTGAAAVIYTVDGDVFEDAGANWQNLFLQYPPWQNFEITTKVNFSPAENYEQASLFVWQDHNNFIRFSNVSIAGNKKLELCTETKASFTSQQLANSYGADLWMRIQKNASQYTFYASSNGTAWMQVGSPATINLTDIKAGFGAASPTSGRRIAATFDFFHVTPLSSAVTEWTLY